MDRGAEVRGHHLSDAVCARKNMTMLRAAPFVLACLVALGSEASAQADYPTRPVRLVVFFAPGGGPDILALFPTQPLSRSRESAVPETRPGGGGTPAAPFGVQPLRDRERGE